MYHRVLRCCRIDDWDLQGVQELCIRRSILYFIYSVCNQLSIFTFPHFLPLGGTHYMPSLLSVSSVCCIRKPLIEGPQHSSICSFVSTHDPIQRPHFPSRSALVLCLLQSSLQGYTTFLSFAWSPALLQTLLEGLSTLPHPPRHSPSCDMVKTPIFQQCTGAQHPQFPPLMGNNYTPSLPTESLLILSIGHLHSSANSSEFASPLATISTYPPQLRTLFSQRMWGHHRPSTFAKH
jgi:hypothetical protein